MSDKYQEASHTAKGTIYPKALYKIKKFKDLKKYFNHEKLKNILVVGEIISFEDVLKCFCPKDIHDEDFFNYMCFDSDICYSHNDYSPNDLNKLLHISSLPYEIILNMVRIEEGNVQFDTHAYYFLNDVENGTQFLIRELGHEFYCDHLIMYKSKIYQKDNEILYVNKSQRSKIRNLIIEDICKPSALTEYRTVDIPNYFDVYWHDLFLRGEYFLDASDEEISLNFSKTFYKFWGIYCNTDESEYPLAIRNYNDAIKDDNGEFNFAAVPMIYKRGKTGKNGAINFFKEKFEW